MNISKAFGLFRKSYIGVYGPDIEILVSKFTTFESVRISISGPNTIEITKVNRPNLMKCIRKIAQCLESIETVHIWLRTPRNAMHNIRISISGPKTIEITKVNRPNLLKCIRKNCPMLGIN